MPSGNHFQCDLVSFQLQTSQIKSFPAASPRDLSLTHQPRSLCLVSRRDAARYRNITAFLHDKENKTTQNPLSPTALVKPESTDKPWPHCPQKGNVTRQSREDANRMVIGKPSAINMQPRLEPSSEPFPRRDEEAGIYWEEAIAAPRALQTEGEHLLSAHHLGSEQLTVLLRWGVGQNSCTSTIAALRVQC